MVSGRGGSAGGAFLPDHRPGLPAILPDPARRSRIAAAGPGLPAFFREAVGGLYPSCAAAACHCCLICDCRLLPPPALMVPAHRGALRADSGPPDRRRRPEGPRTPKKGPTRSEGALRPSNGTLPAWALLRLIGPDRARIDRFFHILDMGKPLYPLRCNALRVKNRRP